LPANQPSCLLITVGWARQRTPTSKRASDDDAIFQLASSRKQPTEASKNQLRTINLFLMMCDDIVQQNYDSKPIIVGTINSPARLCSHRKRQASSHVQNLIIIISGCQFRFSLSTAPFFRHTFFELKN